MEGNVSGAGFDMHCAARTYINPPHTTAIFDCVILCGVDDLAFQFEHQTLLSTLRAIFIKQDYYSTQRSAMAGDNTQAVV